MDKSSDLFMTPGQCFYNANMDSNWIDNWLSAERFAPYLLHCKEDRQAALDLYDWNASLSRSLFKDISYFEVCLRNAYNRVLEDKWTGSTHWILAQDSPVNESVYRMKRVKNKKCNSNINHQNQKNIEIAISRAGGISAAPGKVLAELSFGFWSSLTASSREQSLWIPYLRFAYPKGTDRKTIDERLKLIRIVRNRIAHIEPIYYPIGNLKYNPIDFHRLLFDIFSLLSKEASNHTERSSDFLSVLKNKPV